MNFLKKSRLDRGYSIQELAALSGVAGNAIFRLEAGGTTKPHPKTLRKLAAVLDMTVPELRDGLFGVPA